VDLAHILCDFGVRFQFYTTMLGVNPEHRDKAFYKQTIDADTRRVSELFDLASQREIPIQNCSVSSEQLQDLVRCEANVVVTLVDRRYSIADPAKSNETSWYQATISTLLAVRMAPTRICWSFHGSSRPF